MKPYIGPCVGYDAKGKSFDCPNKPGTKWGPYWCPECNERRLAGIEAAFERIARREERNDRIYPQRRGGAK